ncbi:hypothetical protein HNQ50_001672 [Silvimonas terrae]|uniref:Long-chain-fatty-acyl-CoA reductase n=1 Tax=Silvimonas terrae TaxID=300266 RepID=A0A840RBX2_9NEIS|nr:acyl-CoA reductase [Silvimonas terrae]MBB5190949.1 hypothetical protein [Silvimonas terrae]
MIRTLFPLVGNVPAEAIVARLAGSNGHPLQLADPRMLDFLGDVGQRLCLPARARLYPELGALGVWLRKRHLEATIQRLEDITGVLRFARGLVFHVAPGNADTVFVYSWVLAALAGNHNIVRISTRGGDTLQAILAVLQEALAQADPIVAATQSIVSYDHTDLASTAVFSLACDLRVLWGGDAAINDIRQAPLQPAARDVVFPNRSSFATINTAGWLSAPPARQKQAVEAFHTDAYLFGQAACASPGTLFWVGDVAATRTAQAHFTDLLRHTVSARGPQADAAMVIQKQVATYGLAVENIAREITVVCNEITTVQLAAPPRLPRRWLGTGVFVHWRLDRLQDLLPLLKRQDQTLTWFGFEYAELDAFARQLAGKGIDRIVPLGHALDFSPIWDGYDLLREFTRLVTINPPQTAENQHDSQRH